MVKVLIADDSMLTRFVIRELLRRDPEISVVGEARDGLQAVEQTLRLRPDLVIMDIMMPVMDGLAAVIEIMSRCPTPILVLSANIDPKESRSAFNAIRHGALDVMEKPQGVVSEAFEEIAARLIEKVKTLARVRVIHHFRRLKEAPPAALPSAPPASGPRDIVAIGASTGGPKAIMRLMKDISPEAPAGILIVQHIANGFAEGFATWLDRECGFAVRLARHGDRLTKGEALVAPNNTHMEVQGDRIVLAETPPVNCCRPSIDVLFRSLSVPAAAHRVIAVLLTGMGRDGALGLGAMKRSGSYTIVQDEATCAVFGMPKAAIELGAAHQVLPLGDISAAVVRALPGGIRPKDC